MEQNNEITVLQAIEITENMLLNVELPCKYKQASDVIFAAIKNLEAIATKLRASEKQEGDNKDGQSRDVDQNGPETTA